MKRRPHTTLLDFFNAKPQTTKPPRDQDTHDQDTRDQDIRDQDIRDQDIRDQDTHVHSTAVTEELLQTKEESKARPSESFISTKKKNSSLEDTHIVSHLDHPDEQGVVGPPRRRRRVTSSCSLDSASNKAAISSKTRVDIPGVAQSPVLWGNEVQDLGLHKLSSDAILKTSQTPPTSQEDNCAATHMHDDMPHYRELSGDNSIAWVDRDLGSSQTSGTSAFDDPTPIPIPRKSVSTQLFTHSVSPPFYTVDTVHTPLAKTNRPCGLGSATRTPKGDVLTTQASRCKETFQESVSCNLFSIEGTSPGSVHTTSSLVCDVPDIPNPTASEPPHYGHIDVDTDKELTRDRVVPRTYDHTTFETMEGETDGANNAMPTLNPTMASSNKKDVIKEWWFQQNPCDSSSTIPSASESSVVKQCTEKFTTTKGVSVGSLFGTVTVHTTSPQSNDLTSPFFDPSAYDISKDFGHKNSTAPTSLRFHLVANTFNIMESLKGSGVGSKKKAVLVLTNLFRLILWYNPGDILPFTYFCLNKIAPIYMNVEIGVGETLLLKLVTEVYGRSEKSVKADLIVCEDLGRVAEQSRSKMRVLFQPSPLTIQQVFNTCKGLSEISGHVAQSKKREKIKKLLVAAESSEAKYIIRFLQGKMRMGMQSATVFQALAYAFVLTRGQPTKQDDASSVPVAASSDTRRATTNHLLPSNLERELVAMEQAVRTGLSYVPNIQLIIEALFKGLTPSQLEESCAVHPGIPVHPMLAKPTRGVEEVLTRFSTCEFTCEYKYDGERVQIHLKPDASLALFSRNLETITDKYPDAVVIVKSALKPDVRSCILDSEIVAFDTEMQRILPFQVLSTRKRKNVEPTDETKVKICLFPFDCLFYNGNSLVKLPLIERREYLNSCLTELPYQVTFASHKEMASLEEVDAFLQEALDANCEGLMIKTLKKSAAYEPSKRSCNWLKLKKDYLENLTDSLDLVVMGAFFGRGKRCKVYGAFLLGCYNEEEEVFQTMCKAGTGFSEDVLEKVYMELKEHIILTKHSSYVVHEKLTPDVWFTPCFVWEIRAADLSISPIHTACMGGLHLSKGIGLRFPRFIRVRTDKTQEQATTTTQVVEMFKNQASTRVKKTAASEVLDGEDGSESDEI